MSAARVRPPALAAQLRTIAGYAAGEALRRRVFVIVLGLTVLFLGLYAVANLFVFRDVDRIGVPSDVDVSPRTFAAAFMLGLATFAVLFLGVVLSVFLTIGAVRGDAERNLLQPLVVRPVGRSALLAGRFLAAAAVSSAYVVAVWTVAMAITGAIGHWWPHSLIWPGVLLACGVCVVTALSLLGSVRLGATANGIAMLMLFGAGLASGLVGTIGRALGSHALEEGARIAAWLLPFEALYQDALRQITAGTGGITGFLLELGPFGGGYTGGWPLRAWAAAYLAVAGALALWAFSRRDL